jgi:hypothetical protein
VWDVTSRWWVIGYRHFMSSRVDSFCLPLKMRVLRLLRNVWVRYPIEPSSYPKRVFSPLPLRKFREIAARSSAFFAGKIHPVTGREGTEGDWRYGFSLCLTSVLEGWMVSATLRPLYPRERTGTHCTGGWVDPNAGVGGCGKSQSYRISIPGPSSPSPSLYRLSHPGSRSPICIVCVTND